MSNNDVSVNTNVIHMRSYLFFLACRYIVVHSRTEKTYGVYINAIGSPRLPRDRLNPMTNSVFISVDHVSFTICYPCRKKRMTHLPC